MAEKKTEAYGKEAGEPKKMKRKVAAKNGSSPDTNTDQKGSHSGSSSLSGLTILVCVVIAIVAFAAGVFTPPALSFRSVYESQQRCVVFKVWLRMQ